MAQRLRVGSKQIDFDQARGWVAQYFDADRNRESSAPFAFPAYDELDTGGGPDTVNDGDLLAPTLLNAAPPIRGFFSLQRARPRLRQALTAVAADLTLAEAFVDGSATGLLTDLVSVLDDPSVPMPEVRLTTLTKVLHRKRPRFVPLYDSKVRACYVDDGDVGGFPVRKPPRDVRADVFYVQVASAINDDVVAQASLFAELAEHAPARVGVLRLLDVVAWHAGRR